MSKKWLLAVALLTALAAPSWAETLYLANGEVVRGRIVRVDDQSLSVESEKGYGTLQINKADIVLIEYDSKKREPARSLGLGYFVRTVPPAATAGAGEYGVDALSLKYWLGSIDSIEMQVGFYSAHTAGKPVLEVFAVDLRYASVAQRRASLDIYWGASAGYMTVKDNTVATPIDSDGTRARVFLGAEVFPATLPGLGISAEVGMGTQNVGKQTVVNLSTASFPTFAVRYYF